MKHYDPDLREKLKNIDVRLLRQERAIRLGFAWLSVLAAVALALLGYGVARL